MIPLWSDNVLSRIPFATYLLILANLAVFAWQYAMPGAFSQSVWYLGVVPREVFHPAIALPGDRIGMPLAFLTGMFSHGGLFHLASNMIYLWVFGRDIEEDFGFLRFLIFYLVTGLIATLVFVAAFPDANVPLVGASGAISGVLGAYFLRFPGRRINTLIILIIIVRIIPIPAFFMLGYWILIQFLSCVADCTSGGAGNGGVAWLAHLAGFVAGLVWTIFILRSRYYARRYGT